ncbi:hypothetical protein GCM10009039_14580 [Halocalculus aciditolerans]|uniref:Uncharacterized protein n=2 Tax=Halocalculus aciditolerans TaxID=1383812 RepID=A0A830F2X1_9EURY|nr:hypothetical protein GCM10009039_14580 [Halocalculus aciditolerans]
MSEGRQSLDDLRDAGVPRGEGESWAEIVERRERENSRISNGERMFLAGVFFWSVVCLASGYGLGGLVGVGVVVTSLGFGFVLGAFAAEGWSA